ncbi:MAG: CRISPR-associated protein Cas5 [Bacteroidetes bacterium]|nr:MAG: CRISPR-associated protein Cas5 [Bacteroidota bacterium]
MDILTFELAGKHAHFRKYYANNTALSYFIPPRTTLMGVLAAVMGYPKDSYYEALASEHIRIGLSVLSPLKKAIHRVNWLKVEGASDFRGRSQHTQTPFELVSAQGGPGELVRYQVYLAATASGSETLEQIRTQMLAKQQVYAISLGPANLGGYIRQVQYLTGLTEEQAEDSLLDLGSVVNAERVSEVPWDGSSRLMVEEELMPADFVANEDREVRRMIRCLYTFDGAPLPVRYSGPFVRIPQTSGEDLPIAFIE